MRGEVAGLAKELQSAETPESPDAERIGVLLGEIAHELTRARTKFPGDNVTTLALVEEVGELAKAVFEEPRINVRKEAVQVAVMAMRVVLDGDSTLDFWRKFKRLDPLTPWKGEEGMEFMTTLPSGNSIWRRKEMHGGYSYWTDDIGGGRLVWDDGLCDHETLAAVHKLRENPELIAMDLKVAEDQDVPT